MRKKKCKVCFDTFQPQKQFQQTCTVVCALVWVRRQAEIRHQRDKRQRRKKDRAKLDELQPIRFWINKTQTIFNKFIRLRDGPRCYSCDITTGQFHCGHYRTRAAASQHRYSEINCASQCAQCNNSKSGNVVEFRIRLVRRHGAAAIEAIENDNTIKRWTRSELLYLRFYYTFKTKQLEQMGLN